MTDQVPESWRHAGVSYSLSSAGDETWRVEHDGVYDGLLSRAYPVAGETDRSWTIRAPGDEDLGFGDAWDHWEDALEALVEDAGPTVMGGGIQVFDPDDKSWLQ